MFNMDTAKMNNVQEESLREQKKSKRRSLMLQIARDIISAKGLRELKVRDVAEAANCSIGSVYNEFGDFDGLILTVNRETVQALTARLVGVPAEDPLRQLHGLAATYLEFASEHAKPAQVAVRAPDGKRPSVPRGHPDHGDAGFRADARPAGAADARSRVQRKLPCRPG